MKHLMWFLVFGIVLTANTVAAQQKVYYELGSRFKGLKKNQIRIWKYEYELMAGFKYKNISYTASFRSDSTLEYITKKLSIKECPVYMLSFLNCAYKKYLLVEYNNIIKYENGEKSDDSSFEVIIEDKDHTSDYKRFYSLTFKQGQKPKYANFVEKNGSDYIQPYGVLWPGKVETISKWYGGSADKFCDSLKKHIQIKDFSCLDAIGSRSFTLNINIYSENAVSGYIQEIAPYWLKEQIQSYLQTIVFPKQAGRENANGYDSDIHYSRSLQLVIESEKDIRINLVY